MQIFATLDANLNPVELRGGSARLYWQQIDGVYVENDAFVDVIHVGSWDATALALNRVQAVSVADPAPGQVLQSYALSADGGGVIAASPTYAPAPPAPRAELRKSVVMTRLNDIGKLGAAFSALQANPLDFGKWFSPDWPNVYADDADLLALLNGIGLTADQIARVTA